MNEYSHVNDYERKIPNHDHYEITTFIFNQD